MEDMRAMKKWKCFLGMILDAMLIPLTFSGGYWFRFVRMKGIWRFKFTKKILYSIGVFPILDHYYEPMFNSKHLKYSLKADRDLPGIDFNEKAQAELLKEFHYSEELSCIPFHQEEPYAYYYDNPNYGVGDGEILYSMIRRFKPRTVLEIGSGYSTLIANMAIKKNEDEGVSCSHVCIEPYEMPWLEKTGVKVIREKLEDVGKDIFDTLHENDILFIDSSHIIRPQGDVIVEYLEILPLLQKGVIIHIHDIFTPKDYPKEWIEGFVRLWNEQYLLEAFLSHNEKFEIILANNYMKHHHFSLLSQKCPWLAKYPEVEPGGFWIMRRH